MLLDKLTTASSFNALPVILPAIMIAFVVSVSVGWTLNASREMPVCLHGNSKRHRVWVIGDDGKVLKVTKDSKDTKDTKDTKDGKEGKEGKDTPDSGMEVQLHCFMTAY